MKFKNKATGVVWVIDDEERQEYLKASDEYEEVPEVVKTAPKETPVKKPVNNKSVKK